MWRLCVFGCTRRIWFGGKFGPKVSARSDDVIFAVCFWWCFNGWILCGSFMIATRKYAAHNLEYQIDIGVALVWCVYWVCRSIVLNRMRLIDLGPEGGSTIYMTSQSRLISPRPLSRHIMLRQRHTQSPSWPDRHIRWHDCLAVPIPNI